MDQGMANRVVRFTSERGLRRSYNRLVRDLRNTLPHLGGRIYDIPILLPSEAVLEHHMRYVYVELRKSAEEHVTLVLDTTDAYVLGLSNGIWAAFFPSVPQDVKDHLFTGKFHGILPFKESYRSIKQFIVEKVKFDREELNFAIAKVAILEHPSQSYQDVARSLMVFIVMVSEALRFKPIEQYMREPTKTMEISIFDLVTEWGKLSSAIQSTDNGVFINPVQLLKAASKSYLEIDCVSKAKSIIAIMKRMNIVNN